MNAFAHFPTRLHWTAQQLADAVPLRLHELYAYDATRDATVPAANATATRRSRRDGAYVPSAAHARFRIR